MRVLHLYAGNLFGGIERMLLNLWRARDSCDVMTHHFGLCFEGRLQQQLRAERAPLTMLGAVRVSRPWTVVRARSRLRDLLRRDRFDVVMTHSFWPHGLFAPVVRSAGVPLVMWIHDIPSGRGWLEQWARRVTPDMVLANSRFTASAAGKLFPGSRCEVQYPLVEPSADFDRDEARRRIRAELRTSPQSVVIVMAARWERWKGHALLVEALTKLPTELNWNCWLAAQPQRGAERAYEAEVRRAVTRERLDSRLRLLGHREDIAAVFAAADVYCQPNTAPEPFGVVFVEALAAGLPVVTSDLGAAPEIVDQSCGRLVPPGDSTALAERLAALVRDESLRKTLAQAAVARAAPFCRSTEQLQRLEARLLTVCRTPLSGSVR